MSKKKRAMLKRLILTAAITAPLLAAAWYVSSRDFAVFDTAGTIADQQRTLIIFASVLSLVIVVPVFVLTFYIARKYRVGNKKAKYSPDFDHHSGIEALWWGIPLALIIVLSVVTWISSHRLDPFKPLASSQKPVEIQVVAMQWKWLFIYPEEKIASMNYVRFPEDRPVNFTITSDAPMNSFWIPQLGGQIYAMSGMSTKLHLMADKPGIYRGSSANISGEGFSGMVFEAESTTQADFDSWVRDTKKSPDELDMLRYKELAKPSKNEPVAYYTLANQELYDEIVGKYMSHSHQSSGDESNDNYNHGAEH